MKGLYFIILPFFLSSGCDIPGKIFIQNTTNVNAIYKCDFVVDKTKGPNHINIELPGDRPNNKADIMMGFGFRWTDENIDEYAREITRLEIISWHDSLILSNTSDISNYFKSARHKSNPRVLKIKIE